MGSMIDRQSRLLTKSRKDISKDEVSANAQLLERAGFVNKLAAGIYSYLPMGLQVLAKIENIVRDEMNATSAEELLMPSMTPKAPWEATGRWTNPGKEVMFQLQDNSHRDFGLGWTHEEIVTPLVAQFVRSYRDLPRSVYQVQTKFRDEPRAKSGILRGREFRMKDMYSFHIDEADIDQYYDRTSEAYLRAFKQVGLNAFNVKASGGAFSKYSDEFQVESAIGEDTIYRCSKCSFAMNSEISEVKAGDKCPDCDGKISEVKGIEVGNIFKLGTRYSSAINWNIVDKEGKQQPVIMGCYGIGTSRLMGAVVECLHDDRGMIWPRSIAPYDVHVVNLMRTKSDVADDVAVALERAGYSVLYDDRPEASVGQKLADADLLGMPVRVVISERSLAQQSVEVKARVSDTPILVTPADIVAGVSKELSL